MESELKNLIIKVRALYVKYGIKSMTMDDVARELGMSKKTLYQFVHNKDELVSHVCELINNERAGIFRKIHSKKLNAIQSLMYVNKLVSKILKEHNPGMEYDLKKYHPEVFFKVREKAHKAMYNSVLENLKQGKKEDLYRSNLDDELIAKLYVSRIDSITHNDLIMREEMVKPEFTNQLIEYHIRGIANDKGLIEYEYCKQNFNTETNNL